MTTSPASASPTGPIVPFGQPMRQAHFRFSPTYTPINHGSYGTHPASVSAAHAALQAEAEAAPDKFIVLDWAPRLRESRAATAGLLNCETDDVVFVPNATTGIDTVLKNLRWAPGDVVLAYEVVYDSVRAGLAWLEETSPGRVRVEVVPLRFPVSDANLVDAMVAAARRVNASGTGERVRLAIVDTVVSMPGLRIPFEALVPALRAEGALVLVDAAHGIGHVELDLAALDPDFLVTNLHKWLFVPRGAAALYVPRRNQGLVRTSLPTSFRFRKRGGDEATVTTTNGGNAFVELFDFTATLDMTNFLTVKDALAFRTQVCGGEAAIQKYCRTVAREGGEAAAAVLGTEVLGAATAGSCMLECSFANVRLPLEISSGSVSSSGELAGGKEGKIDPATTPKLAAWFKETGVAEAGYYFQTCLHAGALWWRLSGMVYLDVEDFRRGAVVLLGLCERARKGEYLL
ncbi:putative aminotransferase family protein [Nemania sp. NC0429]|nr:putative aminotransferase family protein [Nemania sp. NC0429]